MNSVCVTGHREIDVNKIDKVKDGLKYWIEYCIEKGYTNFISGFAIGVDLIFAELVIEEKRNNPDITLEAAIPYANRMNTYDKKFQELIKKVDKITICNQEYNDECFFIRNRYMVDNSDIVIAAWNVNKRGGTYYTMNYARKKQKELHIIYI